MLNGKSWKLIMEELMDATRAAGDYKTKDPSHRIVAEVSVKVAAPQGVFQITVKRLNIPKEEAELEYLAEEEVG